MSPLVGIGVVFGSLGYLTWRAVGQRALMSSRVAYRKWKFDRLATSPIAAAQPGAIVKICGRVESVDTLLEAPLSGAVGVASLSCVSVIERTKDGSNRTPYVRDERASDFIVRDASGAALVRGRRTGVATAPLNVLGPDDERKRRWMRRWHAHMSFLGFERHLEFRESVLVPGAEVVVLGRCVERSGAGDGPYRDSAEPTITVDAPDYGCVILDW